MMDLILNCLDCVNDLDVSLYGHLRRFIERPISSAWS